MNQLAASPAPPPEKLSVCLIRRFAGLAAAILGLAFFVAGMAFGAGAAHAAPDTLQVSGTLRNGSEPIGGVVIAAKNQTGQTVQSATSGPTGAWTMALPPGTYTLELDESTVPDGIEVRRSSVQVVLTDSNRGIIFSFGAARQGTEVSDLTKLTRLTIDGLRFGLIIAITGVGLSLIFGTTGLTNFAHGEMVTLGAIVAWAINVKLGVQLIPATIIAIIIGIAVGILNELAIWRPLRRRRSGLVAQLVVSIGLALVMRYLFLIFFSDRAEPFNDYLVQTEIGSGAFAISPINLACIIISLVVLLGVGLMIQKTRIGKAMRAVADNRDLAAASGINVDRVVLFVWALAGGLAALGGVLFALSELGSRVQWEMGFKLLLLMFAGVTLGGLGTAYGALIGCVIVGVAVQVSTFWLSPDLKYVSGLLILIIILTVRPQGILGSKARIG